MRLGCGRGLGIAARAHLNLAARQIGTQGLGEAGGFLVIGCHDASVRMPHTGMQGRYRTRKAADGMRLRPALHRIPMRGP